MIAEKRYSNSSDFAKRWRSSFCEYKNSSNYMTEMALQISHDLDKLLATAKDENSKYFDEVFEGYKKLFAKFISDQEIVWDKIRSLPPEDLLSYNSLTEPDVEQFKDLLKKLVVIRLHGGLATSMGCSKPRSLLLIHNQLSFLDINIIQIENLNITYNVDVPLVLMTSYYTKEVIERELLKFKGARVKIYTFEQNKFPRIYKDTLVPVETNLSNQNLEAWYPPGHGDFYACFHKSGLLQNFIKDGKEICFIANADNLGAIIDIKIINLFSATSFSPNGFNFILEMTEKSKSDIKGGTLVQYEGTKQLLEIAQVPQEHISEFKGVNKFPIFNTNNLWISLKAMQELCGNNKIEMEVISVHKKLSNGHEIIQLERAIAAAIKCFSGSCGIIVPRKRFLPVKIPSDLLMLKSSLYELKKGCLIPNTKRTIPTLPVLKLDPNYFGKVEECMSRFVTVPDMMELEELIVIGDVRFGSGITLRGRVFIFAKHGEKIVIPDGTTVENKVLSGNMTSYDYS